MAKKSASEKNRRSVTGDAPSLFDRENLESLDALRYEMSRLPPAIPVPRSENGAGSLAVDDIDADQIFNRYQVDDSDESWAIGELNVRIVHRGRIRISRVEWRQIINTCSTGFSEDGIRKDFHLNILQHPGGVRLIYISYRYKQSGDKQRECRRGIILDGESDIRELMTHLAYWFTAQPYAEKNYAIWKALVDEAMSKLRSSADRQH